MRIRLFAALGAAVFSIGLSAPTVSPPAVAATAVRDVRVASFNVSSVSFDGQASGNHAKWRVRRPVVVSQILNQKVDVLGLQEVNQSSKYASSLDYGTTQYLDLKRALNIHGANYALTNKYAYNCVRPMSSYNCVYHNNNASQDNRIMYDTDTVSMIKQGAYKYPTQTVGKNERYLVWGIFEMKATGKRFLFTNTHLDPYSAATRRSQWDEAIAKTNKLKAGLPVVAVGDYNTSKFDTYAATYLPKMKSNGYGDVLNQQYREPGVKNPRAEVMKRGWINSFNGFKRDVRSYAYEDARYKVGNGIDWIFVTNTARVKEWSMVTNVSMTTLQVRGVIPSDHNLVRATLVLP